MKYKPKYLPPLKHAHLERGPKDRGMRPNPALWANDDVVIERDIYYGWLKHKNQAKYRGEDYDLTYEQWHSLWSREQWLNRGRAPECDMLVRIDVYGAWTLNNVVICKVKHKGQYYNKNGVYRL